MLNERGFIDAITNGDETRLAELLRSCDGEDPLIASIADKRPTNHAIGFGMTLLQLASIRERKAGNPSKLLIDHGDDVNRHLKKVAYFGWEDDAIDQDYLPWNPIHMASLWSFGKERVSVAQRLASAGADLNAISPLDGFRPIHLVAMPNRVEMIKFFVSRGVDVDSRTKACSAIDLPNEKGPLTGDECTALMVAAAEGFPEATACLLELGADPRAVNSRGDTAMDFAERRFWDGQPYDLVIDLLANT